MLLAFSEFVQIVHSFRAAQSHRFIFVYVKESRWVSARRTDNFFSPLTLCVGELQRQKEFEVAMFMYRTGEQQNAFNAMNSIKTHGKVI